MKVRRELFYPDEKSWSLNLCWRICFLKVAEEAVPVEEVQPVLAIVEAAPAIIEDVDPVEKAIPVVEEAAQLL